MPFMYPRIDISIKMTGIAQSLRANIGTSVQPNDLYEVFNTAKDPSGQPYFSFVNDGTSIKYSKNPKYGKALRSGNTPVDRHGVMTFFAGGIQSQRVAGPNPPVHMRERVLPMIQKYFATRVREIVNAGKPFSYKIWGKKTYTTIGGASFTAPKLSARVSGTTGGEATTDSPHRRDTETSSDQVFTQAMEDTMDYTIIALASLTPILKSEYDASAEGYTTTPGTLRDSYQWAQVSALLNTPGFLPFLGSSKKRLTPVGGHLISEVLPNGKKVTRFVSLGTHKARMMALGGKRVETISSQLYRIKEAAAKNIKSIKRIRQWFKVPGKPGWWQ